MTGGHEASARSNPPDGPGGLSWAACGDSRRAMQETLDSVGEPIQSLVESFRTRDIRRLVFTGEGCSYTATVAAAPLLKHLSPIPVETILATNLQPFSALIDSHTCLVCLSRTGERRYVLDALADAREAGALVVAMTGNPQAAIRATADTTLLTQEGSEPAYLKVKSTLAGMTALLAFAAALAEPRIQVAQRDVLGRLPELADHSFKLAGAPKPWLAEAASREHWAILGSGAAFGAAADTALKLQETSVVHASAHPIGFFYHGPLGAVRDSWGAFVFSSFHSYEWTRVITYELARAGASPIVVFSPEPGPSGQAGVHHMPIADPLEVTESNQDLADHLAPIALLPAAYMCLREVALARSLNPDVPPNMDYMLSLILPEGRSEPDLVG